MLAALYAGQILHAALPNAVDNLQTTHRWISLSLYMHIQSAVCPVQYVYVFRMCQTVCQMFSEASVCAKHPGK